jgi:hypothetical protein
MKIRKEIFYLIGFMCCLSCKDENSNKWTEVHVTAKNYWTQQPIDALYCSILEPSIGETNIKNQAYTQNGQYDFGFVARKNPTYILVNNIDLESYHSVYLLQSVNLKISEINTFEFSFLPISNFSFHIQNQNCFDDTDSMWFKTNHLLIDYQSEDWNPLARTGCYDLSTGQYPFPVGPYEFMMKIKRNGAITYITKEVNLFEDSATLVELYY